MADGSKRYAGTAFYFARPVGQSPDEGSFVYLVTAKHVINTIRDRGIGNVLIRANTKSNGARWITTRVSDWGQEEPRVPDVAVLPVLIEDDLDHLAWPLAGSMFTASLEANQVDIGEDVFLTGLFHRHAGRRSNIPIIRVGNIAALPDEKISTKIGEMDGYLIEARSIGGLSGSPVFVHLGGNTRVKGFSANPIRYYLLGLVHGHYDEETDEDKNALSDDIGKAESKAINMGIAIVVPVDEVLGVMEKFNEIEKTAREKMRKASLPTMDSVEDEEAFTKKDFEDALKRVSRRIQPSQSDEGTSKT